METRICKQCKKIYPIENFAWKNKIKCIKSKECRECNKKNSRKYYNKNKEKHKKDIYQRRIKYKNILRKEINEYKRKTGCMVCGEKEPICLDFHHRKEKKHLIANLIAKLSFNLLKKEIKKCNLVCSNCHRKIHANLINDENLPLCDFKLEKLSIKKTK